MRTRIWRRTATVILLALVAGIQGCRAGSADLEPVVYTFRFPAPEEYLVSLSSRIARLQNSPGRLLQTLEEASLGVWETASSGVGTTPTTVSYYVKGAIVGFLLDVRIRSATGGERSLDDVMRLAYQRYGGERGFTPEEFRATVEEVAGADLTEWFRRAVASTEELDYEETLDWYGLRFAEDGSWRLEGSEEASITQEENLQALLASAWQDPGP